MEPQDTTGDNSDTAPPPADLGEKPETGQKTSTPLPYRFSGKCAPASALALVLISLACGIGLGALYYYVSRYADLVIVDCIIGGLLVGLCMVAAIRIVRCRNVALGVALALLAGVLFCTTRLVLQSQAMRPLLVASTTRNLQYRMNVSREQANAAAKELLSPTRTLIEFLRVQAYFGVPHASTYRWSTLTVGIGDAQNELRDESFDGAGFWAILALDFLLAAWIAAVMVRRFGFATPYCESCGRWMSGAQVAKVVASRSYEMKGLVAGRNWDGLLTLQQPRALHKEVYASATLYRCAVCSSGTVALANHRGSSVRRFLHVQLDPGETTRLWTSLQASPAKTVASPEA